jgi:hypothetical protein
VFLYVLLFFAVLLLFFATFFGVSFGSFEWFLSVSRVVARLHPVLICCAPAARQLGPEARPFPMHDAMIVRGAFFLVCPLRARSIAAYRYIDVAGVGKFPLLESL